MATRMFKDHIWNMVEVYIDDVVITSKKKKEHVPNLVEVFEILR